MSRFARIAILAISAWFAASGAQAQLPNIPASTVLGRTAIGPGQPQPIPYVTLFNQIFGVLTGTSPVVITQVGNGNLNISLGQAGASSFLGNPTAAAGNPVFFTIPGLSINSSPNANNDYVPCYQGSSTTLLKCTVGSIAGSTSSGVTSLNGQTGGVGIVSGTGIGVTAGGGNVTVSAALPTVTASMLNFTQPASVSAYTLLYLNTVNEDLNSWFEVDHVVGTVTGYFDNGSGSAGTLFTVTANASSVPLFAGQHLTGAGVASNTILDGTLGNGCNACTGTPSGTGTYGQSISQLVGSSGSPITVTVHDSRVTPKIAGLYHFDGQVECESDGGGTLTRCDANVFQNGAYNGGTCSGSSPSGCTAVAYQIRQCDGSGTNGFFMCNIAGNMRFNGSTDYAQFLGRMNGTNGSTTSFDGELVTARLTTFNLMYLHP